MHKSGKLVRKWRLNQKTPVGLNQMARDLGISNASLSRIETGQQGITPDILPKLVKYTKIPAAALCPDLARLFATEAAE